MLANHACGDTFNLLLTFVATIVGRRALPDDGGLSWDPLVCEQVCEKVCEKKNEKKIKEKKEKKRWKREPCS